MHFVCFQNEKDCLQNAPFNEFKEKTDGKFNVTKEVLGQEGNSSTDTEETNIDQHIPVDEMEYQSVSISLAHVYVLIAGIFCIIWILQGEHGGSTNNSDAATTTIENIGKSFSHDPNANARLQSGISLKENKIYG